MSSAVEGSAPSALDRPLAAIRVARKSGQEPFTGTGWTASLTLSDFWQWSASDVVGNTERGALAEFIVGTAIGAETIEDGVRDAWGPYDLRAGDIKVEVKAAAYVQSWDQAHLSAITFGYAKTRKWDPEAGTMEDEPSRVANVYVFCLLKHQDQATLNPLDMSQWEFYVVPTRVLNERKRSQSSITLRSLRSFCDPVDFDGLRDRIRIAAAYSPRQGLPAPVDELGCDWSTWQSGC